jgi:hypothetical protein
LLDALDNFVVFQQVPPASGGAAFFNGFDKARVVLEHAVHGFLHELGGILACAARNDLEASFLIR